MFWFCSVCAEGDSLQGLAGLDFCLNKKMGIFFCAGFLISAQISCNNCPDRIVCQSQAVG